MTITPTPEVSVTPSPEDMEAVDKEEEKVIIYLDGKFGNNKNSGKSPEEAVKTFKQAKKLVGEKGIIYICGTVNVKKDVTWKLPDDVELLRAEGFEGPLVRVSGSLILEDVDLYIHDIKVVWNGVVEGALEKEIPEVTPQPAPEKQELTEEEKRFVQEVQNLMDYLPEEISSIEAVEAVIDATKGYESLSEMQRAVLEPYAFEKLIVAQEKVKAFNRQSNQVLIEGDLPWYVQFQVVLTNDKTDTSVLEAKNIDTVIAPYDLKLWDLMHDTEYKLNGQQVRITMPAPDQKLYTQLVVLHYLEDGTVEYITPIYNENGTISFVTTSFSPYSIAGSNALVGNLDKLYNNNFSTTNKGNSNTSNKGNSSSVTPNKGNTNSTSNSSNKGSGNKSNTNSSFNTNSAWSPRTGDEQNMNLYVCLTFGALVLLITAGYVMKKNKKKC